MAAVTLENKPLTHFITDVCQPNTTPSKALESKISSLSLKAFAFSSLEKISFIALLAIMATVFTISYSAVTLTGAMPFVVVGLVLSTSVISIGLGKFTQLSRQFSREADFERGVLAEYRNIEVWQTPEITQFLQEERVDPARIPLKSLSPLLPLIARYNFLKAKAEKEEAESQGELPELDRFIAEQEREQEKPQPSFIKQKNRFECQELAHFKYERQAVPSALSAAVLLNLIQNPTQLDLDIQPMSLEIPRVGHSQPRSFAERLFGRTNPLPNDDYFHFLPGLEREPLTLKEIEDNFQPRDLRLLLFPNAIRA